MRTVNVNLGKDSYEIRIQRGLIDQAGEELRRLFPATRCAVITDQNVDGLYGQRLQKALEQAGFQVERLAVPAGEASKCLAQLGWLYDRLAEIGLTRSDLIVTLGGGVPGDLGGLASATFLRGLAYVQIPTTLLAQVDSSVGGKTAIDLPAGKNLVGCFYQPRAVLIDPDLLETLPPRFLRDGMAEVVKYGCIADESFFSVLEALQTREEVLEHSDFIVESCCRIKADLVARDERDKGARMTLNFGHTVGHAVEKHFGYSTYSHGEGVAVGMACFARVGEEMGLTSKGTAERLRNLLSQFELPVHASLPQEKALEAVRVDKKKAGGEITLVLLKRIGEAFLKKASFDDMAPYLAPLAEGDGEGGRL